VTEAMRTAKFINAVFLNHAEELTSIASLITKGRDENK
jgi:hypothetical protein